MKAPLTSNLPICHGIGKYIKKLFKPNHQTITRPHVYIGIVIVNRMNETDGYFSSETTIFNFIADNLPILIFINTKYNCSKTKKDFRKLSSFNFSFSSIQKTIRVLFPDCTHQITIIFYFLYFTTIFSNTYLFNVLSAIVFSLKYRRQIHINANNNLKKIRHDGQKEKKRLRIRQRHRKERFT